MKKNNKLRNIILFIFGLILVSLIPLSSYAAIQTTATIDESSLVQSVSKPYISGTAFGTKKVWITVYKDGETKKYVKSKSIKVKEGIWKSKISKTLKDGSYKIVIKKTKNTSKILATGTLIVDKNKKAPVYNNSLTPDLIIGSIPLLFGGTALPGQSVPVSYLQVNNVGKNFVTIKGFIIKQNGSASDGVITELSTVDDKGGSKMSKNVFSGEILFKNGLATAPTDAVIAPGQMKLFTIKASLSNEISANIGKNLMIDVVSIESNGAVKGNFPIRGTTWIISNY
jgi:hypothetical protein